MKPGSVIVDLAGAARRQLPAHRSRQDRDQARRHAGGRDQPAGAGGGRRLRALRAQRAGLPQARRCPRKARFKIDLEDDIVAACLMTQDGQVTKKCLRSEGGTMERLPHRHQPDHLRAGHLRGLPRGVDRHARAAHAADGGDQRHLGHRDRGRHAGGGADRNGPGQEHGRAGRGAGRGQHLRRLPGHAPHARDVQEEGQEAPKAAASQEGSGK